MQDNSKSRMLKKIVHGKIEPAMSFIVGFIWRAEYGFLSLKWKLQGGKRPNKEEQSEVVNQVTFIYKSFERQKMAKRLFKSIQHYYPGVQVIIADDSKKSLQLCSPYLKVIQLPFNSGLSYSMNQALKEVKTPFLVRLDDDMLLTPFSKIGTQIDFLNRHPEIDLVGLLPCTVPQCNSPEIAAKEYYPISMSNAPKSLLIPHMTKIDDSHVVVGKSPNIYVARTCKIKMIGWDDNIRMMDHNEFFMRAAGNLVSTIDTTSIVFHYPNHFDRNYMKYRSDVQADQIYIANKYSKVSNKK
ncbi:MAG: glycosyltransferase family 2 protein [Lachnospiraceae bacterium]|nr:glycosyltransferase family 2 protein [Lachnospiraceae bacterium]